MKNNMNLLFFDKNILTNSVLKNIIHVRNGRNVFPKSKGKGVCVMNDNKLILFTRYLLDIMFYSGILVVITLPLTIRLAGQYYSAEIGRQYWIMLIIFGLAGICGLVIVFQLRKMIRTVIQKNCFVDNNTKSLRVMGKVSFLIVLLFVVKCVLLPTPATFIIVLTFFIAGLFSHVLSLVFAEAVSYKEENDLTI